MKTNFFNKAISYPYSILDYSFILYKGRALRIRKNNDLPQLRSRHPVIACGSNLSHERLKQKFNNQSNPLPTTRIKLKDFDTVYAAHFANYGSIPATLHPSPGTEVSLALNWLDSDQLLVMHATEKKNYQFYRLNNLKIEQEFGPKISNAFAYISTTGCWTPNNTPIPLAEISAKNRLWKPLKQKTILKLAQNSMEENTSLEDFILKNIENINTRSCMDIALQKNNEIFSYEFSDKIDNLF